MRGWVWVRFIVCVEFTLYNTKSTKNSVSFTVTSTCAELCCQTTWGHIPQLFAKFEPCRRQLRRETSAKVLLKVRFWMHAFDWPEQTVNF